MLKRDEGRHQVGHEENAATGVPGETREIRIVSDEVSLCSLQFLLISPRAQIIFDNKAKLLFFLSFNEEREKETTRRASVRALSDFKGQPSE